MQIKTFFDNASSSFTYLIYDTETKEALIIDPVLDNEESSTNVKTYREFLSHQSLTLKLALDTHVHADHKTAVFELEKEFPGLITGIFESVSTSKYNYKFKDHQELTLNDNIKIKCLHTPGHTPSCTSFLIHNHLFTGDTLFMPDFGTGRCDFPGGSAESLYHSIQKLYNLPKETIVHVGHDYAPGGRQLQNTTTIAESLKKNIHLNRDTSLEDFVAFRTTRDEGLSPPKKIESSLKYNL